MTAVKRLAAALLTAATLAAGSIHAQIPGRNVNMVSGTGWVTGDPFLQRQNEPSIAASTRNPLHLLAGGNDYRTIDLPGLGDEETADAWLGVYKSTDGGQRWTSSLLPGFRQDGSAEGLASPLRVYQAAADPVVRAGTNGLFYYAGLAFDRTDNGKSAIFVARFIDNNNKETGDATKYLGTKLVALDSGVGGTFLDKPWMAVDVPRLKPALCTIVTEEEKGPLTQKIPAGNVYVAYSAIAEDAQGTKSEIRFSRSTDCGVTWSTPVVLSKAADRVNQGATIAIEPNTGAVYVAWRRFDLIGDSEAIMVVRSPDGKNFGPHAFARKFPKARKLERILERLFEHRGKGQDKDKDKKDKKNDKTKKSNADPIEAAELAPFDQGTSDINELIAFRTNAYPTMTFDHTGRAYMAWSERGYAQQRPGIVDGDARIVLSTSTDGLTWTVPQAIAETGQQGHQIMPSLTFAGGRLLVAYYDLQEDRSSVFTKWVDDRTAFDNPYIPNQPRRHTFDLRTAMAPPGAVPVFWPSVRVSDYMTGVRGASGPLEQLQVNPPNLPMFRTGTAPFIGDYIDVAPSPAFVRDATGVWRYNTEPTSTPPVFHAAWTDNRDVRPPRYDTNLDGNPWNDYTPPTFVFPPGENPLDHAIAPCVPGNAGSRNQNLYTARITGGLLAGSPGNTKTLSTEFQRAFVVFAQNTTGQTRVFRFTILNQPIGGKASFNQFPVAGTPDPLVVIDATVPARSTASRTVYATSTDPHAQIHVDVSEVAGVSGAEVPGGLDALIRLNPDLLNPEIDNPEIDNPEIDNPEIDNAEVYTPEIDNPEIDNPEIDNPEIDNPEIDNPEIDNIRVANPEIDNPEIDNPEIDNPEIDNPEIDNPEIDNAAVEEITDVTWNITNTGNTTAAFNINVFLINGQAIIPNGLVLQLIIHKTYKTPVAQNCDLKTLSQTVLVSNILNPEIVGANGVGLNDPNDPEATNATLWLAPGEIGKVTLRIYDPDAGNNVIVNGASIDPGVVPEQDVSLILQAQSVGTEEADAGETEPPIVTTVTSNGAFIAQPYSFVAGVPSQVGVRISDETGAVIPGAAVQLSLVPGVPGAVLTGGGPNLTNEAGLALFPLATIDRPGAGYRLQANITGVAAPLLSDPFNVYEACVAAGVAYTQRYRVDGPAWPDRPKIIKSGVDWGNDGREDVVVVSDSGVFYTMNNVGGGSFAGGYLFAGTTGGGTAADVATGDFNSDGWPDVVVAKGVANTVVYTPLAAGSSTGIQTTIGVGDHAIGLVAGRFNSDTFLDLAVLRASSVRVLFGDGTGAFPTSYDVPGMSLTLGITGGDFDADGDLDLLASDSPGVANGLIYPIRNNGDGTFTLLAPAVVPPTPARMTVQDFNLDGHLDVAVAHAGAAATVLFGDGAGVFGSAMTIPLAVTPGDITSGQYDSDGIPDIAVTLPDTSVMTVLFGRLTTPHTFVNPVSVATDPGPMGIATGDFNGDGRHDLATANRSIGSVDDFNTMSVLLGSCGAATADIGVALVDGTDPVNASEVVMYTATITNHGPFDATNVVAVEQPSASAGVPVFDSYTASQGACVDLGGARSCTIGLIPAGSSVTLTFTYHAPALSGTMATTVIASADELDLAPATNSNSESTNVQGDVTFMVVNTNNAGAGSFRQAMTDANAHPGRDFILFNIPGAAVHTITLNSVLIFTDEVVIDGTSQPGFAGTPIIEVTGPAAGLCLNFQPGASNSVIQSLAINRCNGDAIQGFNVTGLQIYGNYLGVDTTGNAVPAGGMGNSVRLLGAGSSNNVIGGTGANQRNVMGGGSGNVIEIESGDGNVIVNNYIGIGADGVTDVGSNLGGIYFGGGATANVIGMAGAGNVISGANLSYAITFFGATDNIVRGNLIGTTAAGNAAVPNKAGIWVDGANNIIGGLTAIPGTGDGNVISGNNGDGVFIQGPAAVGTVVQGNIIGLGADGTTPLGNSNAGVRTQNAAAQIGGVAAGARNVLSANNNGIALSNSGSPFDTFIEGNFIGTDISGMLDRGNAVAGISNGSSPGTRVGGSGAGGRNLISGNPYGVYIYNTSLMAIDGLYSVVVQNNAIGLKANGTDPLPNGTGVRIESSNVLVGGLTVGERNIISGNTGHGIQVFAPAPGVANNTQILNNFIGTTADGAGDAGNGQHGIRLEGGGVTLTHIGSVDKGNLISGNDLSGISTFQATNTSIEGNRIGVAIDGVNLLGNTGAGVAINNGFATIGGVSAGQGNLISGNGAFGVRLDPGSTFNVRGNRIGTDFSGTARLPNGLGGIFVDAVSGTIGGDTVETRNLISGNAGPGVWVAEGNGVFIEGNYIGTNAAGNDEIGNTIGVRIDTSGGGITTNIGVGDTLPGQGNLISGNVVGVYASAGSGRIENNYIGLDASGTAAVPNQSHGVHLDGTAGPFIVASNPGIAYNLGDGVRVTGASKGNIIVGPIYGNGGLGIDLGGDGITPNDLTFTDLDDGGNTLQNYPFNITARNEGGNTRVTGTFDSSATSSFDIRVYVSPACDDSGHGEGKIPRGVFTVNTNGAGSAVFDEIIAGLTTPGYGITMTATNVGGNTSEFSECVTVSNIEVSNTNNSGPGSLRDAITAANSIAGMQTITFNLGAAPHVIAPLTPLPAITDAVIIDGTTEPGYAGTPVVMLDGGAMGTDKYGLEVFAAGSTIRGLVISGFAAGPMFKAAAIRLMHPNVTVEGNYIGTDMTGTAAVPNYTGVLIESTGNTIGGTTAAARNVISGNTGGQGVWIKTGGSNLIYGNYIGVDAGGTTVLGNDKGVLLDGADDTLSNHIGGDDPSKRNVISGNIVGVLLRGGWTNFIAGNYIGMAFDGVTAAPNHEGISVDASGLGGDPFGTFIGGSAAEENVISGNLGHGISLGPGARGTQIYFNKIGVDASGGVSGNGGHGIRVLDAQGNNIVGNVIAGNSGDGVAVTGSAQDIWIIQNAIYLNSGLSIDLEDDGVTANDVGDGDAGANFRQNYPVVVGNTATDINVTLNSAASLQFHVEAFIGSVCGHAEAFHSQVEVVTDGAGNVAFTMPSAGMSGHFVMLTASGNTANTSELSACFFVP